MTARETLGWALSGTLMLTLIFRAHPEIDLAVSALFYDSQHAWPLREATVMRFGRSLINGIGILAVLLTLIMALLPTAMRRGMQVPRHVWTFLPVTFLLGVGAVVHEVLKIPFGRVRPYKVDAFGGDQRFTIPFDFNDACVRNCSFVSGEVAGIALLGLVVCSILVLSPPLRRRCIALAVFMVVVVALMRISTGRHFLSDAVFAALFMAAVVWIIWRAYGYHRAAPLVTPAMVAHDVGLACMRAWGAVIYSSRRVAALVVQWRSLVALVTWRRST